MLILPASQLAFVFKCLSDTIILDDFGSALDRVRRRTNPQDLELRSFDAESSYNGLHLCSNLKEVGGTARTPEAGRG
jgi:hypothetical protein